MSDGFWRASLDFISLILILVAGIELGLIGFFGFRAYFACVESLNQGDSPRIMNARI